MSEKITDKELIMLIQEHANGKEPEDELIFRAAIELKTYRDLERHGLFCKKTAECDESGWPIKCPMDILQ